MLYRRMGDGSGYVSGAELMTFEPVALAAGSDDFIQDDEGVQEMRENPVIIKNARPTPNIVRTVSRSRRKLIISNLRQFCYRRKEI